MGTFPVILLFAVSFIVGTIIGVMFAGPITMTKRKIGSLNIDDRDPEKTLFSFEFDIDPDDIPRNDYISVKTREIKDAP